MSIDLSTIQYYHSLKTLTTLSLRWNQIGNEGAKHLAEALKENKVRHSLL
jgi:hypothetical protein